METPGHTLEHIAWLVYEDGIQDPVAVFSGGSLIVGNAGRTDLLGPDFTDDLTRAQFRSLKRLASLPPQAMVLPTHGAGSFCAAAPPSPERTTTLAAEIRSNQALLAPDEETFRRQQLSNLLAYPAYYSYMAPINRKGPRVYGKLPALARLSAEQVAERMQNGAWLIEMVGIVTSSRQPTSLDRLI